MKGSGRIFKKKVTKSDTGGRGCNQKGDVTHSVFYFLFVNFFCNQYFAPLYLVKLIKFEEQPFAENFTIFTGKYLC